MSPGGWWTALILAASAVGIAGLVVYCARLDGSGDHTHRNVRRDAAVRRGAAIPFADPADRTDPDGEQYIARLSVDGKPFPDLGALTPGPVGTGWLEPLPDDPPADITGVQPHDVRYHGMPSGQYVDELFEKHAEAQQ
jgi:hypothetical protein